VASASGGMDRKGAGSGRLAAAAPRFEVNEIIHLPKLGFELLGLPHYLVI